MDNQASQELLGDLLSSVSRTFYLTLRILPGSIRPQIGLAYLLARATDTIADTQAVAVERRLEVLGLYRDRILDRNNSPIRLEPFAQSERSGETTDEASQGERILLTRIEEAIALLAQFSAEDQTRIREVIDIIAGGQQLDLQRFGTADAANPRALQTDAELDDYTWWVAGCVGEFWTRMCLAHVFRAPLIDTETFVSKGIRFGKGLQLVNILRDIPADLRKGRCYLPVDALAGAALKPRDLLQPAAEARLRPTYDAYLTRAHGHLAAGWDYTLAIPSRFIRLRLACAWPILIGAKTLVRLRSEKILDPTHRVKVTRAEVRKIMRGSIVALAWPRAWQRLFDSVS